MNKKISINNDSVLLFIINICMLFSNFIFYKIYNYLVLSSKLYIIILILDVILLIFSIIYNFLLIIKHNDKNFKKSLVIFSFIIYIIINTFMLFILYKFQNNDYHKEASKLLTYCKEYGCNKYEIVRNKNGFDFIIKNTYLDYNNIENDYEIHNIYSNNKIISLKAVVYSENEAYSYNLINRLLSDYFSKFNVKIDSQMIKEAFESRFEDSSKKSNNITYKVKEIYQGNELIGLKTIIKAKLQ